MFERPKITGKTKRDKAFFTSHGKEHHASSRTKKIFNELNLIYAPRLVFADSCKHLQGISIQDLAFYHEDPVKYDQLSETYGSLIGRSYVAPGVIRWISEAVGHGYFTTHDILKGDMAGEYTGKIMLRNEFEDAAYAYSYPKSGSFQDTLPERISLDARTYGNEMRFVNHSDTPCLRTELVFHGGQWHIVFVAKRDIKKGEEFQVSYGQKYWRKRKKLNW